MTSPITAWLSGAPGRAATPRYDDFRVCVELTENGAVVGVGYGASEDEAKANALNDCMARMWGDGTEAA